MTNNPPYVGIVAFKRLSSNFQRSIRYEYIDSPPSKGSIPMACYWQDFDLPHNLRHAGCLRRHAGSEKGWY
jgi:hypothetical protein